MPLQDFMELLFHRNQTKLENPVESDTLKTPSKFWVPQPVLCVSETSQNSNRIFSPVFCPIAGQSQKIFLVAEEERLRAQQNKILFQSFTLSISIRSVKATGSIINNNICQKRFSSIKSLPARGSLNPPALKSHQTPHEFFRLNFFSPLKNPLCSVIRDSQRENESGILDPLNKKLLTGKVADPRATTLRGSFENPQRIAWVHPAFLFIWIFSSFSAREAFQCLWNLISYPERSVGMCSASRIPQLWMRPVPGITLPSQELIFKNIEYFGKNLG